MGTLTSCKAPVGPTLGPLRRGLQNGRQIGEEITTGTKTETHKRGPTNRTTCDDVRFYITKVIYIFHHQPKESRVNTRISSRLPKSTQRHHERLQGGMRIQPSPGRRLFRADGLGRHGAPAGTDLAPPKRYDRNRDIRPRPS